MIGGSSEGRVTNKLMTLHYNGQWIEELPPMKSASTLCAAVCVRNGKFRNHVIVIGGKSQDGGHTHDVQFFNTVTRCWYDLTPLPQPAFVPSAAVCGNMLHVIGSNAPLRLRLISVMMMTKRNLRLRISCGYLSLVSR